jgi:hypothetical protein
VSQFSGESLVSVLQQQSTFVSIKYKSRIMGGISPEAAVALVNEKPDQYFGVGNQKRIRFLRYESRTSLSQIHAASQTTRRIRDDRGRFAYRDRTSSTVDVQNSCVKR